VRGTHLLLRKKVWERNYEPGQGIKEGKRRVPAKKTEKGKKGREIEKVFLSRKKMSGASPCRTSLAKSFGTEGGGKAVIPGGKKGEQRGWGGA